MTYEAELPYRRVSLERRTGRSRQSHHEPYDERQSGRRSIDTRQYDERERNSSNRDQHKTSSHNHRHSKVPLEEAVGRLHDTMFDAVGFYEAFQEDFAQETRGINAYTTSEILERLWTSKVNLNDKRGGGGRDPSLQSGNDNEAGRSRPPLNFWTTGKRVIEAFALVIKAVSKSNPRSASEAESMERLRTKLNHASREVKNLLHTAHRRVTATEALVSEMQMLLTFLDGSKFLHNPRGHPVPRIRHDSGPFDGADGGRLDESGEYDPEDDQEHEPGMFTVSHALQFADIPQRKVRKNLI
ncbi:hypothetical protein MMC12_008610 [Toensbergia leucococca]|nr:hypothetical protein [Toensbergia leucococca]